MGKGVTLEFTADGAARLDVLDGLRGLAVILVVLYHATMLSGYHPYIAAFGTTFGLETISQSGFIGVSLFFFISGFCLFYPYARHRLEGARRPALTHYAYRRFIKIVPSYLIALTAMAIVFHDQFKSSAELARHYILHVFFLHVLAGPATFPSISGPFWTLGVEVEFYVIFPLLALAMMRAPIATFVATGLLAISYRQSITGVADAHYYYVNILQAHIDTFVTGMLAAYYYVRLRRVQAMQHRWVRAGATVIALAAFTLFFALLKQLGAYGTLSPPWNFYRWDNAHRVAMELTFFTMTLGTLFGWRAWHALVANRVLVWFSLISYNLYLWHDGIILSCRNFGLPCNSGPYAWQHIPNWGVVFFVSSVGISIALAAFITYGIERPLLQSQPRDWIVWRHAAVARLRPVRPGSEPT